MDHTGATRSAIAADHALITPESHVPIAVPGWNGAETIVLISRELGAKFGQYLVHCHTGSELAALAAGSE